MGTNSTGCTEWERDFDPKTEQPSPEIDAGKIVAEFESIFGKLTATERRWLTRRIAGQEVMRLCLDCHRSYISEWINDHAHSTPKSE